MPELFVTVFVTDNSNRKTREVIFLVIRPYKGVVENRKIIKYGSKAPFCC